MSTTSGSRKSRLDFNFSKSIAETLNEENTNNTETIQTSNEVSVEEKKETLQDQEKLDVNNETKSDSPSTIANSQNDLSDYFNNQEEQEILSVEDMKRILRIARASHGVQKSVYIENKVDNFIRSQCLKYDTKYSTIVNLLLKKAISDFQKSE